MPVEEIDVNELRARLDRGARLVDVREPGEWVAGRVPGATLIPLGDVPVRADEFGGGPVHLICRTGARSMRAAEFLARQGHDVVNVAGGTLAWLDAGYDVETGS